MRRKLLNIIVPLFLVVLLIIALVLTCQNVNLKNKTKNLEKELSEITR